MRPNRTVPRSALPGLAASLLALALGLGAGLAPRAAQAKKPKAAQAAAEPAGETVDISGRIMVGLDKVVIKDAQGYCLVPGQELARYAGRNIQARAVVLKRDQDYRTVRLLHYRIQSPDDDSPGAGGTGAAARPAGKK